MRLDEFAKYKKLIESDGLIPNEDAEKVYKWMKETGRLDEGFFGAVWRWLKRNFSIKARRIHALGDEYEKELIEETRAEYNAMKSKQDLAAKFRKSWTGRLSHDIKERMDIIAGDDNEYRELVRTLINKKNLTVRRMMIKEFTGQLDPEDVRTITSDLNREQESADAEYNAAVKKTAKDDTIKFKNISNFMEKKIAANSSMFKQIYLTDKDDQSLLVAMLITYTKHLSEKIDKIKYDSETVWEVAKKYVHLVKDIADKIDDDLSSEEKMKVVRNSLNTLMKQIRQVRPIEDYRSAMPAEVKKNIEKIKSQKTSKEDGSEKKEKKEVTPDDLPNSVVTPESDEVSDIDIDTTVEDAVDATKEETGKKHPSADEVASEITDSVRKYFNDNAEDILSFLKKDVTTFNEKSDDEKKKLIGKFEYTLDNKNMLAEPTMEDLKLLLEDFIKIAGKIVPYYEYGEKSSKYASMAVAEKIFQIYAIKKNLEKRLSDEDVDNIVNAIKTV